MSAGRYLDKLKRTYNNDAPAIGIDDKAMVWRMGRSFLENKIDEIETDEPVYVKEKSRITKEVEAIHARVKLKIDRIAPIMKCRCLTKPICQYVGDKTFVFYSLCMTNKRTCCQNYVHSTLIRGYAHLQFP